MVPNLLKSVMTPAAAITNKTARSPTTPSTPAIGIAGSVVPERLRDPLHFDLPSLIPPYANIHRELRQSCLAKIRRSSGSLSSSVHRNLEISRQST